MKWLLSAAAVFALAVGGSAEDKKPVGPITLTLVAKTDKYKFDGGGKTPAEYKKELEAIATTPVGEKRPEPPKPPAVDFVLVLTNTSKEDVTIYVGGDSNSYVFELTGGAGVVSMGSNLAFTADFKLPKAVALAAGKTYEIPVKRFSDGSRGAARYVYWTGPGEYKLSVSYTLSNQDGSKVTVLKSEPVKITVTDK